MVVPAPAQTPAPLAWRDPGQTRALSAEMGVIGIARFRGRVGQSGPATSTPGQSAERRRRYQQPGMTFIITIWRQRPLPAKQATSEAAAVPVTDQERRR